MHRPRTAFVPFFAALTALAACQTSAEPEASGPIATAEQALTDCLPNATYCSHLQDPGPPVKAWAGSLPSTAWGSVIIATRDPQGVYVAYAADPSGAGNVAWARAIPGGKIDSFLQQANLAGVPVVDRPAPRPNPPRMDDFLELAFRTQQAIGNAWQSAEACAPFDGYQYYP